MHFVILDYSPNLKHMSYLVIKGFYLLIVLANVYNLRFAFKNCLYFFYFILDYSFYSNSISKLMSLGLSGCCYIVSQDKW
jgi:RsiW-degrading membrane proteinase PrsW (M82 family)